MMRFEIEGLVHTDDDKERGVWVRQVSERTLECRAGVKGNAGVFYLRRAQALVLGDVLRALALKLEEEPD